MKLLVVSNLYPPAVLGGYEVECQVVVDALRERGDEVVVLTGDRDAKTIPAQRDVRRELAFLSPDARGALRSPSASLRNAQIMHRTLSELRPDLVWVWNGAQIPQAALVTALRSPFPVAFRVCQTWFGDLWHNDQFLRHLYGTDTGPRRAWALALRSLNRRAALRVDVRERHAAHVVWNSYALQDEARVPPVIEPITEEVLHTSAARGPLFAAAQRRPPTAGEPPTIAYVGRANADKGIEVAVEAVVELRRRHGIPATLVVAGIADPHDRKAMDALVAAAGLPPSTVQWLGAVDAPKVVELFETAAAALVVSVAFDAFPQVCIEAAYARVPVVGSDSGGIPECLHPDEHALIVLRGDAVATAAALARVLTEPEDAAARAERARSRADDFQLDHYLEASKQYVDRVVAASRLRA